MEGPEAKASQEVGERRHRRLMQKQLLWPETCSATKSDTMHQTLHERGFIANCEVHKSWI